MHRRTEYNIPFSDYGIYCMSSPGRLDTTAARTYRAATVSLRFDPQMLFPSGETGYRR